jgi:hypothetical protein
MKLRGIKDAMLRNTTTIGEEHNRQPSGAQWQWHSAVPNEGDGVRLGCLWLRALGMHSCSHASLYWSYKSSCSSTCSENTLERGPPSARLSFRRITRSYHPFLRRLDPLLVVCRMLELLNGPQTFLLAPIDRSVPSLQCCAEANSRQESCLRSPLCVRLDRLHLGQTPWAVFAPS